MIWQTEFDELVQYDDDGNHLAPFMNYNDELPTNTPEEVVAAQVDKDHGCNHDDGYFCTHRAGVIKAFIQDLLDMKAREIKKAKWRKTTKTMLISYYNGRMGFHTGDGKHQDHTIGTLEELQHSWYNQGVDDALSILKEAQ